MAWFNAGLSSNSGGASSFNELDDVSINTQTLSNGQVPVYNSTTHKWENGEQSSGSSGHTILNDGGSSLTQRDNLQFKGAYSEDNSANGKTVVNVVRSMTKAQFNLLSANEKVGFINVTDESGSADRNYSETTLWSGSETPSTSGTDITLTDDISNYDEIVFCIISEIGRKSQESFFVSGLSIGETYIEETYPPENIGVFWVYTSGTSIKIYRIASASGSAITYTKVVGIKYGNGTKTFHNYSTAEQIVGTWVDGKLLYEKTFTSTTIVGFNSSTLMILDSTIPSGIEVKETTGLIDLNISNAHYSSSSGDWFSWYVNYYDNSIYASQSLASATPVSCITAFTIRYTKSNT